MTINTKNLASVVLFTLALLVIAEAAVAQSAAFTYQGRLTDAGNPADGLYEMQFKLFDTTTVGTGIQQGSTVTDLAAQVTKGIFTWKDSGKRDFGLNAEDVAEVEAMFVARNDKGEVEGVNEGSFNVLFINAFKEQQQQIKLLLQQIDSLKKIVCLDHPDAQVCK